nr:hypothetical protein CFP56_37043 [Quercus suber]
MSEGRGVEADEVKQENRRLWSSRDHQGIHYYYYTNVIAATVRGSVSDNPFHWACACSDQNESKRALAALRLLQRSETRAILSSSGDRQTESFSFKDVVRETQLEETTGHPVHLELF